MHFHKGDLATDTVIKSPLSEGINRSENHIYKRSHPKYMLKVKTVTKSF